MDIVDAIIEFENGDMSEEKILEFFVELANTGTINSLQGRYGRSFANMLKRGFVVRDSKTGKYLVA